MSDPIHECSTTELLDELCRRFETLLVLGKRRATPDDIPETPADTLEDGKMKPLYMRRESGEHDSLLGLVHGYLTWHERNTPMWDDLTLADSDEEETNA